MIIANDDIRVETITPQLAEEYLGKNTHNRRIRQHRVDAYASDIEAGRWAWNGEAIKFSDDGTLLDGQHRLRAIIQSGIAVQMLVIRGLPKTTQTTMDTGINRKFSDVLQLRGEASYVALAAAVRSVHMWIQGGRQFSGSTRSASVTNTQLLDTLNEHPWIRDVIPLLARVTTHGHLPIQVSGALYYAFSAADPDDCAHFFERLGGGISQSMEQPIFTLAKVLVNNKENARGKLKNKYIAAITIKAWNAYRAGDDVGLLRYQPGGMKPEPFPEPK